MLYTKIFSAKVNATDVLPAYDWAIANRSNGVLRTDAHSMLKELNATVLTATF